MRHALTAAALGGLALACETDWRTARSTACATRPPAFASATRRGVAPDAGIFRTHAVRRDLRRSRPARHRARAECAYHGPNATSVATTTWGASVLRAREDGRHYMWVAELVNECDLGYWRTNSEVALAVAATRSGRSRSWTTSRAAVGRTTPPRSARPTPSTAARTSSTRIGDGRPVSGPPADYAAAAQTTAARARASRARARRARPRRPPRRTSPRPSRCTGRRRRPGRTRRSTRRFSSTPRAGTTARTATEPGAVRAPERHGDVVHPASGEQARCAPTRARPAPRRRRERVAGLGRRHHGHRGPVPVGLARRRHALFHWINHDCGGHTRSADGRRVVGLSRRVLREREAGRGARGACTTSRTSPSASCSSRTKRRRDADAPVRGQQQGRPVLHDSDRTMRCRDDGRHTGAGAAKCHQPQ